MPLLFVCYSDFIINFKFFFIICQGKYKFSFYLAIGPVTEIPNVWKPPPKARRRRASRVAPEPVAAPDLDYSTNILQKFDVDKVPLEPDDFETIKINQMPVK